MKKAILGGVVAAALSIGGYIQYASSYPETVSASVMLKAAGVDEKISSKVIGDATTSALIYSVETLLNKPGGYQSNDILVKLKLYDNMPNFEKGVIFMARDLANAMRLEMSRSKSQSIEDPSLKDATPLLNMDTDRWILPSTESRYSEGVEGYKDYLARITDPSVQNAQFYARADNLTYWLDLVSKRLGSYSQRLSASIDRERLNTDLAGDASAEQSTASNQSVEVKSDWLLIDDTFWEARGGCWALIQYLRAIEEDFSSVLEDKNALVSLQQVIRELEGTQQTMWSPMVFNGAPFGIVSNHSLSMANYISRANAAIIDLQDLLNRG